MRASRVAVFLATALFAACVSENPVQPGLDDLSPSFAKSNQRAQCSPKALAPGINNGSVTAADCVFNGGPSEQYLVTQGRLGTKDGNQMATFSLETEDFDWVFGLGGMTGKTIFPSPVYAFRFGNAGSGFPSNTFSLVGGEPVYKMWVGGRNPEQVGDYTLTATAEPLSDTCGKGHRVYLQGDVTFTHSIANENSCRFTIEVGPNKGEPLNSQYWWIRVSAGETITLALEGVEDPTMAAAIIDLGTGQFSLDLADGPGDADRFVTFTAQQRTDIYVEVSSAPDVEASYTATVNGPDTR